MGKFMICQSDSFFLTLGHALRVSHGSLLATTCIIPASRDMLLPSILYSQICQRLTYVCFATGIQYGTS